LQQIKAGELPVSAADILEDLDEDEMGPALAKKLRASHNTKTQQKASSSQGGRR